MSLPGSRTRGECGRRAGSPFSLRAWGTEGEQEGSCPLTAELGPGPLLPQCSWDPSLQMADRRTSEPPEHLSQTFSRLLTTLLLWRALPGLSPPQPCWPSSLQVQEEVSPSPESTMTPGRQEEVDAWGRRPGSHSTLRTVGHVGPQHQCPDRVGLAP